MDVDILRRRPRAQHSNTDIQSALFVPAHFRPARHVGTGVMPAAPRQGRQGWCIPPPAVIAASLAADAAVIALALTLLSPSSFTTNVSDIFLCQLSDVAGLTLVRAVLVAYACVAARGQTRDVVCWIPARDVLFVYHAACSFAFLAKAVLKVGPGRYC